MLRSGSRRVCENAAEAGDKTVITGIGSFDVDARAGELSSGLCDGSFSMLVLYEDAPRYTARDSARRKAAGRVERGARDRDDAVARTLEVGISLCALTGPPPVERSPKPAGTAIRSGGHAP